MIDFINSFWTAIEISDLQNVVTTKIAMEDKTRNFYFVPADLKHPIDRRMRDDDVIATSTFFVDIDIKENLKEDEWQEEQTEQSIVEYWDWIVEFLKQSITFWRWSYIVFSGNWLQVHFIGDKVDTEWKKNQWKYWVKYFLEEWDTAVQKSFWVRFFRADKACCNLARLRRLPWTINQKNWRQTRVLYKNDWKFPLHEILPRWEEYYAKIVEKEQEVANKQREMLSKTLTFNENNIFERINSIPIELIVSEILPQAIFDWKKNFRFTGQKNLCWFYKTRNRIANGGSHYFQPYTKYWGEMSSYSVFDLVHIHILGNTQFDSESIKKTLYFFINNYGQQK